MSYTIEDFWKVRLRGVSRPTSQPKLAGWSVESSPSQHFIEADLHLRNGPGYDDLAAPIWFVAAPGAVGKSTLAKEISARTGAIYLDLARADTVAGNYVTGGLAKDDLFTLWGAQQTTVLIDALDEARLRVTQTSFEDFLGDVETLARGRQLPTVLFGRVGIVDEAWLILADRGLSCPVFDIEFFDTARAKHFVMVSLERLSNQGGFKGLNQRLISHHSVYRDASAEFVQGLEGVAKVDGSRFAGYAPVLEAAATVLAGVTNPASLNATVTETMQGRVLQGLSDQILDREAGKLRAQMAGIVPEPIRGELYAPEEQLARLASIILGTPLPCSPVGLDAQYLGPYESAVSAMIVQHPFLDGSGRQPSGAVFAAVINAHALFSAEPLTVTAAAKRAGDGPGTPNPFLIDFYLARAGKDPVVPPEHVVILYDSIRARAVAGDIVRLTVDGAEDIEDADVEIQMTSGDAPSLIRHEQFRTSQAGVIRFGRQVSGVSVDAPLLDAVVGSGNPVELVAPVSLRVGRLSFDCPEVVVQRGDRGVEDEDAAVLLEAGELFDSKLNSAPLVRKGAVLSVAWPGAASYPWTQFAGLPDDANGGAIDDALRSLRRLAMAFRSHSKGRLARYQYKIEHARMTKGALGVAVRQRLMADGILTLEGKWYFLDSGALGRIVGATYQDLKLKRFNDKVRQYVASIGVYHA